MNTDQRIKLGDAGDSDSVRFVHREVESCEVAAQKTIRKICKI